ncbi:hypothetical protein [Candidatus Acetatifactor stercoripullorum]|uniref:hypothetical protein n=1 Tax=Candidatus Acetatifactor stercoripullorum TaxID=2838414 RepID=UPI00298E38BE|nr:hypothetical protein [Candidatus Acetatifactor stercoripullorum]
MRISICVGKYAAVPYCVPGLELSVHCIEELCYCIRENAFLIDASLMNDDLVNWIDKDCGLTDLAKELYPMVHKKGSLSSFVTMILEFTGLYDGTVTGEVEQTLKKGAGLSGIEKRKSQIDYLVKKKKYGAAIRGYEELLSQWQETLKEGGELPAGKVRSGILHNKGVAFAGLMLYAQAAECFLEAYGIEKDSRMYEDYLAAKRMELAEEAYIAFAAENPQGYEAALKLEQKMEELKKNWRLQPEFLRLQERKGFREDGEMQKYCEDNEQIAQALKSSYRISAG